MTKDDFIVWIIECLYTDICEDCKYYKVKCYSPYDILLNILEFFKG